MTDQIPDPTTLEDALLGITLLESMVDVEKEDIFEQMTDDLDTNDLFRIYTQLCMFWLMTEADNNQQSPIDYVKDLRKRMITGNFSRWMDEETDPE